MADCAQFTCDAATMADVQINLERIWAKTRVKKEWEMPGMVAMKVLEGQGMRPVAEIIENKRCVGWKTAWVQNCDETAATKLTDLSSTDCTLPEGDDPDCDEATYELNCFFQKAVSFSDQDCSSLLSGADQAAMQLDKAYEAIRKAISDQILGNVVANAKPNTYADTYGTVNGTRTEFTSAEFTSNLLYHIQYTAMQNHMNIDEMCMLDGSNFWEIYQQTIDGRCCTNEGERNAYNRYDISFDKWLDNSLGRRSTFLFDPAAFGIINTTRYTNVTPLRVQGDGADENTVWAWMVEDPVFSIRAYDANGNSIIRPLRYDIEYTKICCGKDKFGIRLYKHNFVVTYMGVDAMSPIGCNDGQPILEFTNIG